MLLDGRPVLLLCSNNYLGLADHPRVREAAAEAAMRYGAGSGASRLISGNMTIHRRLEEQLAAFKGAEACLLFGSGFLANAGVVSALAREGDVVFSDALNHASIVDGCRLSRAETFVYDHCDVDHLEWGLRQAEGRGSLIVTDGVFSMDGDLAPLPEIVELAQRYDARVMVDEAHGTGCVGPGGRGLVAEYGLEDEVDVIVGTLGKALGSYGAYVLCDKPMSKYLINTARTLIFSTALSPPAWRPRWRRSSCCASSRAGSRSCSATRTCCARRWRSRACRSTAGETPIVPLIVGDADAAMAASERALERGVFAQAIRPPTVPDGTSRLRLAVMASHTKSELREAARVLAAMPSPARRRQGRRRGERPPVFDGLATPVALRRARPGRRRGGGSARGGGCWEEGREGPDRPRGSARAVRNRHRHRGGQVGGRGGDLRGAAARGEPVAAFKPVVTGLDEPAGEWPPDHELLARRRAAGSGPSRWRPTASAPRLAALRGRAGGRDDRARAAGRGRSGAPASVLVAEGVGGLLVPITPGYLVRDLAIDLGLPVVIAARTGLGTINHSLLTVEAARTAGLSVAGVVMTPWPAAPEPIEVSNRGTVERLAGVRVAGCAPTDPGSLAGAGSDLPLGEWLPWAA